jgi:putative flippase GtrA
MLKNILLKKSDKISVHLLRAILASGFSFSIDFGLLALLTEVFKIHYLVSNGVSFLTGTTICYILNTLWVFHRRRLKRRHIEYMIFVILGLSGAGLNELLIWAFTEKGNIHYLISKILAGSTVFFFNFFTRKYVLFHEKTDGTFEDQNCLNE